MLSLKTIGKRCNETEVTFRGQTVTVRGLTLKDRDRLDELFLKPVPPLGKDPRLGDAAPVGPLTADPEYRVAYQRHTARKLVMEFAVAVGWETESGLRWDPAAKDDEGRAWAQAALREISALEPALSEAELDGVFEAVGRIERGDGDPRKNSSSTSAAEGAAGAGAGVESPS